MESLALLSEFTDSPKRNSVAESRVREKKRGWRSMVEPSVGIWERRVWMWGSKVERFAIWDFVKFGRMSDWIC